LITRRKNHQRALDCQGRMSQFESIRTKSSWSNHFEGYVNEENLHLSILGTLDCQGFAQYG
jgi:hypothetical protein